VRGFFRILFICEILENEFTETALGASSKGLQMTGKGFDMAIVPLGIEPQLSSTEPARLPILIKRILEQATFPDGIVERADYSIPFIPVSSFSASMRPDVSWRTAALNAFFPGNLPRRNFRYVW
jgi:hypothetical protein